MVRTVAVVCVLGVVMAEYANRKNISPTISTILIVTTFNWDSNCIADFTPSETINICYRTSFRMETNLTDYHKIDPKSLKFQITMKEGINDDENAER